MAQDALQSSLDLHRIQHQLGVRDRAQCCLHVSHQQGIVLPLVLFPDLFILRSSGQLWSCHTTRVAKDRQAFLAFASKHSGKGFALNHAEYSGLQLLLLAVRVACCCFVYIASICTFLNMKARTVTSKFPQTRTVLVLAKIPTNLLRLHERELKFHALDIPRTDSLPFSLSDLLKV